MYTVFCPKCSNQFHAVIVDDLTEVTCMHCKQPVKVSELSVIDVEPLCNKCGTASSDPKIVFKCATCGKQLKGADLLAGTGLAYYFRHSKYERLQFDNAQITMVYEVISDIPRLASKEWSSIYSEPLVPDENNDYISMKYWGKGVSIKAHPLKDRLHLYGCGHCKGENVMIIYAQWSVSAASGNEYWDYEMFCSDCGKYTSRSFSEN